MSISAFFNMIRWKNLLLIALMQFFIKYFLLSNFGFQTQLTNASFILLVLSTIMITASGYIINDIIDIKGDIINKPNKVILIKHISKTKAFLLYKVITFLGLTLGIILCYKIDKPIYSFYFIGISAILYFYSKLLKGKVLIGNIVVSLLLSFSILIVLIFEYPTSMNSMQWSLFMKIEIIIYIYAIVSFFLNLIREIIKDIEDVDGDYNQSYRTLPILIGKKRARNITIVISICTLFLLLYIGINFIDKTSIFFYYLVIFILLPFSYFIYKLWDVEKLKNYKFLSKTLKIIILLGVISIPLISIYFKNAFN